MELTKKYLVFIDMDRGGDAFESIHDTLQEAKNVCKKLSYRYVKECDVIVDHEKVYVVSQVLQSYKVKQKK